MLLSQSASAFIRHGDHLLPPSADSSCLPQDGNDPFVVQRLRAGAIEQREPMALWLACRYAHCGIAHVRRLLADGSNALRGFGQGLLFPGSCDLP
jgi:hypothetical protein